MNIEALVLRIEETPSEMSHFSSTICLWANYEWNIDLVMCKVGNRTRHSRTLCLLTSIIQHWTSSKESLGRDWQFPSRWSEGALLWPWLSPTFLFAICDFFSKKALLFKLPRVLGNIYITKGCVFKLNKMWCSLIFLMACGKAAGRKNMGFGGRIYFNSISDALWVISLFSKRFVDPSELWVCSPHPHFEKLA